MTDQHSSDDPSAEIDRILVEYYRRLDAGEKVDREQLASEYPEHAKVLAELLAVEAKLKKESTPVDPLETPTLLSDCDPDPTVEHLPVLRYFGEFELLEEVARGGMGVVYKARQTSLKRTVAIKMILAGQLANDTEVQRFHIEAEAAAKLQHPHIVRVFEVGDQDGQHYFSMEYIEGQNLVEMVREHPLPAREAVQYIAQIAEAIEYAHQEGVLHRDLKPSNVLIDAHGAVKVTDFGLAKQLESDQQLTGTDQILGTPSYMPPEQAVGNQALMGPASDVYSLGAVLYHLLTGRPPFAAATPLETIHQVLNQEPVSPRLLESSLPKDLETICLKCLQKEPQKRYLRMQELAEDLQRFLENRPILARPISRPARLWRWCRRRPMVASLTLACLCLLVAGTAFSTFYALAANQNAWQANQNEIRANRNAKDEQIARKEADVKRVEAEKANAEALASKRETERELHRTEALRLTTLAQQTPNSQPLTKLKLSAEAVRATHDHGEEVLPEAYQALVDNVYAVGGQPLNWPLPKSSDEILVDPTGKWCAYRYEVKNDASTRWNSGVRTAVYPIEGDDVEKSIPQPIRTHWGPLSPVKFSRDGKYLASRSAIWNLTGNELEFIRRIGFGQKVDDRISYRSEVKSLHRSSDFEQANFTEDGNHFLSLQSFSEYHLDESSGRWGNQRNFDGLYGWALVLQSLTNPEQAAHVLEIWKPQVNVDQRGMIQEVQGQKQWCAVNLVSDKALAPGFSRRSKDSYDQGHFLIYDLGESPPKKIFEQFSTQAKELLFCKALGKDRVVVGWGKSDTRVIEILDLANDDDQIRLFEERENGSQNQFVVTDRWILSLTTKSDPKRAIKTRLWSISNEKIREVTEFQNEGITAAAFHPSGNVLVTAHQDQRLRFWDSTSTDLKLESEYGHGQGIINLVQFSNSGNWLVACDDQSLSTLIQFQEEKPRGKFVLRGHDGPVQKFFFNENETALFTFGPSLSDSSVPPFRKWDLRQPHPGDDSVVLKNTGSRMLRVAGFEAQPIGLHDEGRRTFENRHGLPEGTSFVISPSPLRNRLSPDRNWIAGSTRSYFSPTVMKHVKEKNYLITVSKSVSLANLSEKRRADALHAEHYQFQLPSTLASIAFSSDSQWFIASDENNDIHRWNLTGNSGTPQIEHALHAAEIVVAPQGDWCILRQEPDVYELCNVGAPTLSRIPLQNLPVDNPEEATFHIGQEGRCVAVVSQNQMWVTEIPQHDVVEWKWKIELPIPDVTGLVLTPDRHSLAVMLNDPFSSSPALMVFERENETLSQVITLRNDYNQAAYTSPFTRRKTPNAIASQNMFIPVNPQTIHIGLDSSLFMAGNFPSIHMHGSDPAKWVRPRAWLSPDRKNAAFSTTSRSPFIDVVDVSGNSLHHIDLSATRSNDQFLALGPDAKAYAVSHRGNTTDENGRDLAQLQIHKTDSPHDSKRPFFQGPPSLSPQQYSPFGDPHMFLDEDRLLVYGGSDAGLLYVIYNTNTPALLERQKELLALGGKSSRPDHEMTKNQDRRSPQNRANLMPVRTSLQLFVDGRRIYGGIFLSLFDGLTHGDMDFMTREELQRIESIPIKIALGLDRRLRLRPLGEIFRDNQALSEKTLSKTEFIWCLEEEMHRAMHGEHELSVGERRWRTAPLPWATSDYSSIMLAVLMVPNVLEELVTTENQRSEIDELLKEYRDASTQLYEDTMTKGNRYWRNYAKKTSRWSNEDNSLFRQHLADHDVSRQKLSHQVMEGLSRTLSEDQRKRWKEISLQRIRFSRVYQEPWIADQLKLTPSQLDSIQQKWSQYRLKYGYQAAFSGNSPREYRVFEDQLLQILTDDQLKKYLELRGIPFKVLSPRDEQTKWTASFEIEGNKINVNLDRIMSETFSVNRRREQKQSLNRERASISPEAKQAFIVLDLDANRELSRQELNRSPSITKIMKAAGESADKTWPEEEFTKRYPELLENEDSN